MVQQTDVQSALAVFAGYTGADRIYAGKYWSGLLKLVLFMVYVNIFPETYALYEFRRYLALVILGWYIYDIYQLPMTFRLLGFVALWLVFNTYLYSLEEGYFIFQR